MPKSLCKILTTDPFDITAALANSRTFTFRSSYTMSSIFSMKKIHYNIYQANVLFAQLRF